MIWMSLYKKSKKIKRVINGSILRSGEKNLKNFEFELFYDFFFLNEIILNRRPTHVAWTGAWSSAESAQEHVRAVGKNTMVSSRSTSR